MKLFFCIEAFLRKLTKKIVICVKKVFFSKNCAFILLHKGFLLFWNIFTEIDQKIVIYVKKNFLSTNWAIKGFCCFEAFLQKLAKNLPLRSKYCFSLLIETHTGVFLIKISKIQLIKTCLLYWISFTEIDKKIVILFKKVFFSTNWAIYSYTLVFCCFDEFLQKFTKNLSFRTKKYFSH